MNRFGVAGLLVSLGSLAAVGAQAPRMHELALTPAHGHWGYYDSRVAPALRMASGERVRVETMVAGGLQRLRMAGVAESEIPDSLKAVEQQVTERGPGAHPMTGPIFVAGAEPGDMLEVRILAIEFLHNFGVNAFSPGGGVLPDEFPYARVKLFRWPAGATTLGLNEDLDEASRLAVREMVDFLVAEKGMARDDAYMLCSLAGDLHVTQAVDATKGVHVTLAKSLFK